MSLGRSTRAMADLSDEELVARFQGGNGNALEILIDRYRGFRRAKAYFLVGADADDIEQERLIGLFKAARDYRREHRTPFRPFAQLCITRQIISAMKAAIRQKHVPLNHYVSMSSSNDGAVAASMDSLFRSDPKSDPAEQVVATEHMRDIRMSMAGELSDLEAAVLRLHINGKSYDEIAELVGRQTKAIDNALQRIRRKMNRYLEQ
jgi:RNA polymerase sporulation-specific sigma factor